MPQHSTPETSHRASRNLFGVFAKYWEPGSVKTRLASTIGAEPAARLHALFLWTLLRRFAGLPANRLLVYTPAHRSAEFAAVCGPDWLIAPQSSGDLGARMASFFQTAFDRAHDRVVLIGSDSPTLPLRYVEQAFELLSTHSVVVGPSVDGGYYLIGASHQVPPIFDDIRWSTGSVLQQTMARLTRAGVTVALLPAWYDVDELVDLRRLHIELQQDDDAALQELAEAVRKVLGESNVDG